MSTETTNAVNPASEPSTEGGAKAPKAPVIACEGNFGEGLEKIQFVIDEKSGEWEFGTVTKSAQALLTIRSLAALWSDRTQQAQDGAWNYLKSVGHKIVSNAYHSATKEGQTNVEHFMAGVAKAIIPPKTQTIGSLKEDLEKENQQLGALSIAQYVTGADRVKACIDLGIKTTKQDGSPLDDESLKASVANMYISTINRVLNKQVALAALQAKAAQAKAKAAQKAPAPAPAQA